MSFYGAEGTPRSNARPIAFCPVLVGEGSITYFTLPATSEAG